MQSHLFNPYADRFCVTSSSLSDSMSCCSRRPRDSSTSNSGVPTSDRMNVDQPSIGYGGDVSKGPGDTYIIHDLVIEGNHIDACFLTWNAVQVVKMHNGLDDELRPHCPPHDSILEFASSDAFVHHLRDGVENGGDQDSSWAMKRWKSQPFEALPWHCSDMLKPMVKKGPLGKKRPGPDEKGLNEDDAAIDSEEQAWSNNASAGSREAVGASDK